MKDKRWILLLVFTLIGMAVVWMLGDEYRNEVRALLRAIARAL